MATESDSEITEATLRSLGEKLASLELTDPERAALSALLTDDDVAGFGRFDLIGGIKLGLREHGQGGVRGVRAKGVRAHGIRGGLSDPLPKGNTAKPGEF